MEDFPKNPEEQINGGVVETEQPMSFEEHMRQDFGEGVDQNYSQEDEGARIREALKRDEWIELNFGDRAEQQMFRERDERMWKKVDEIMAPHEERLIRERQICQKVASNPESHLVVMNPRGERDGLLLHPMMGAMTEIPEDWKESAEVLKYKVIDSKDMFMPANLELVSDSLMELENAIREKKECVSMNVVRVDNLESMWNHQHERTRVGIEELQCPAMQTAIGMQKVLESNTKEVYKAFSSLDEQHYLRITQNAKYPYMKEFTDLTQADVDGLYRQCKNEAEKQRVSDSLRYVCPYLALRNEGDTEPFVKELKEQNRLVEIVWRRGEGKFYREFYRDSGDEAQQQK